MSNLKSSFLNEAVERGFIYQTTNMSLLDSKLASSTCTAYVGFDATADCLHVGHLLPIFLLRMFQKHGHKGIALLGGATTKIGDPSFKNTMRPMLSNEVIDANIRGMKKCLLKFVNSDHSLPKVQFVNNADWLENISYIEFLRNVGIHFSVNRMMTFDSVKSRLKDGNSISFMEFNYMLMQAYDFLVLHDKYGADIQLGGQDQWGNIVCGVELLHKVHGKEVIGCTVPLLTTSNGEKMGKTVNGAVWLDDKKLSVYDFWQYWRNIPDDMVEKCLKLFTDLPIDEVKKLASLKGNEINEAKKTLADNVTAITHGKDALQSVHEAVRTLFGNGNAGNCKDTPSVYVSHSELNSVSFSELLVRCGVSSSKSESKRLLRGGAVVLDGAVIDESRKLNTNDANKKLVIGKKRAFLIRLTNTQ